MKNPPIVVLLSTIGGFLVLLILKTIYSINEKGRSYFMHMMEKYSEKPGMVYIDFIAFIANLHNVGPENGLMMIKNLQSKLLEERKYIQSNIVAKKEFVAFHASSILELYDKRKMIGEAVAMKTYIPKSFNK